MTAARSGVLVAGKPAAVTSFDVVTAVRRVLKVRRVGHAGTLDPDAVGVLPILIGEATKLMPYLADQDKEYRATVRFGVTTDTLDMSGRVISTRPVTDLDRRTVEAAVARFVGRIAQVPPMYSAVHHEGRRLYEIAREGRDVERAAREVVVHRISVGDVGADTATLSIVCGKGTYVRVLVADLGEVLGCGAAVEHLVRTRVGPFTFDAAIGLGEVATSTPESLWARVLPAEAAIAAWPALHLDDSAARAFVHGQAVATSPAPGPGALRRVHDRAGRLLGVGEIVAGGHQLRPVRILHVDRSGTPVLP